jgi:asparagine synthetase B (glutamine-hydrolysing)
VFNDDPAARCAGTAVAQLFATGSDTEVLLRLVTRGGARLADVRRMFAFACWDTVERSFLLSPRPVGIAALHATSPRHITFASELGTLRASNLAGGGRRPPASALGWGSVPPPLTWRRGVEMLGPALARWGLDAAKRARRVADYTARDRRFGARGRRGRQASGHFAPRSRPPCARRPRIWSAVPVGVSGGIDSGARLVPASGRRGEPADIHRGFRR